MKTVRLVIFIFVALAQLSVPATMIWQREHTLRVGRVWKFRTAPVDPEDAVRGRYIRLRFVAEEFTQPRELTSTASVWAILKEGADGFAEIDHLADAPPSENNAIKVEPASWQDGKQRVTFPFQQFWVTETNAPAAERAYAANSNRQKQNAYVTVRVRKGDAMMEQLYIDGQPLPDYLRAHPAH